MPQPLRILIVEDRPDSAELMLYEIRRAGFDPEWQRVENEPDFVTHLSPALDLILADYTLPQFNAMRALQITQEQNMDIPFIVVTGITNEEIAVECVRQGAADYLLKDRLARLGQAIQRALAEKAMRAEKKRAEETLHFQARLMENVSDAIIATDMNSRITIWNRGAEEIYGWQAEAVIEKNFAAILEPDYTPASRTQALRTFMDTETWEGEVKHKHRNGAWRHMLVSATTLRDDKGIATGVVMVNRDITERKQRERETQMIVAVSTALRSSRSLPEMLTIIVDQLISLLDSQNASIIRHDPQIDKNVVVMTRGHWNHAIGDRFPRGQGVSGHVITTGQPYVTADILTEPAALYHDLTAAPESVACVPMITQGRSIGAILLGRIKPAAAKKTGPVQVYPYTNAELRLLTAIADIAANAIQRVTLHERTEQRAKQLTAINALGRALTASLDLPRIYRTAHTHITEFMDCPHFTISLFDAERKMLTSVFAARNGQEVDTLFFSPVAYDADTATTGHAKAILTGKPVIVNDLVSKLDELESNGLANHPKTQSAIYTPIVVEDQVIGRLDMRSYANHAYTEEDGELLSMIGNQIGLAITNARLFAQTELRLQRLTTLRVVDRTITSSFDLTLILDVLLRQIITHMRTDAADILLLNPYLHTLEQTASVGFRTKAARRATLSATDGIAGRTIFERRVTHISNLANAADAPRAEFVAREGLLSYYGIPLIAKGKIKGVLEIFYRTPVSPDQEWLSFMEMLAEQAAIAIDNLQLFEDVQKSNAHLSSAYEATIEGWSRALDLRDKETEGHTQRVSEFTLRLAATMNLNSEELVHLRRGALLHDIGKMGIPDAILLKPDKLTDTEWAIMRQHPLYAYELLAPITYLRSALDIPYCHHEKWDGTGYPRGLKNDEIPLAARLFAVADVWDALISDRPYRSKWQAEDAVTYIQTNRGKHFDPKIVDVFSNLVRTQM